MHVCEQTCVCVCIWRSALPPFGATSAVFLGVNIRICMQPNRLPRQRRMQSLVQIHTYIHTWLGVGWLSAAFVLASPATAPVRAARRSSTGFCSARNSGLGGATIDRPPYMPTTCICIDYCISPHTRTHRLTRLCDIYAFTSLHARHVLKQRNQVLN